jgi:hypothetical protein
MIEETHNNEDKERGSRSSKKANTTMSDRSREANRGNKGAWETDLIDKAETHNKDDIREREDRQTHTNTAAIKRANEQEGLVSRIDWRD